MIGAKGVANTMAPFCIAMTVAMLAAWVLVPNPKTFKINQEEENDCITNIELNNTGAIVTEDNSITRLRVSNNNTSSQENEGRKE